MKRYSFTVPKKKPLLNEDTKLWLIFILISLVLYIAFGVFLIIKSMLFQKDTQELLKEINYFKTQIVELNAKKEFIYKEKSLYENILVKNSLVKEQIKNLLDLIPDPITLEKFYIDNNKLIIYGITPTKDVYNVLMLPPLQSIFEKTVTYFYPLDNGWYKFKSENYIKSLNGEKN